MNSVELEKLQKKAAEAGKLRVCDFDDLRPISAYRAISMAHSSILSAQDCLRYGLNPDANLREAAAMLAALLASSTYGYPRDE